MTPTLDSSCHPLETSEHACHARLSKERVYDDWDGTVAARSLLAQRRGLVSHWHHVAVPPPSDQPASVVSVGGSGDHVLPFRRAQYLCLASHEVVKHSMATVSIQTAVCLRWTPRQAAGASVQICGGVSTCIG